MHPAGGTLELISTAGRGKFRFRSIDGEAGGPESERIRRSLEYSRAWSLYPYGHAECWGESWGSEEHPSRTRSGSRAWPWDRGQQSAGNGSENPGSPPRSGHPRRRQGPLNGSLAYYTSRLRPYGPRRNAATHHRSSALCRNQVRSTTRSKRFAHVGFLSQTANPKRATRTRI